MRDIILASLALIAGCTAYTAYRPKVDLSHVNLRQYEQDMDDCILRSEGLSFASGNPIAECMARRGYRILAN
jgi:hypothetical protein